MLLSRMETRAGRTIFSGRSWTTSSQLTASSGKSWYSPLNLLNAKSISQRRIMNPIFSVSSIVRLHDTIAEQVFFAPVPSYMLTRVQVAICVAKVTALDGRSVDADELMGRYTLVSKHVKRRAQTFSSSRTS
jgi:hypothetical protein